MSDTGYEDNLSVGAVIEVQSKDGPRKGRVIALHRTKSGENRVTVQLKNKRTSVSVAECKITLLL